MQMVGERRHGCTPGDECQKGHCRRPLVARGSTGVLSILTANHCTCLKPCHVCLICIGLDLGSGPRRRRHVCTGNTYMGSGPEAHIQQLVPMCWESLVALVCLHRQVLWGCPGAHEHTQGTHDLAQLFMAADAMCDRRWQRPACTHHQCGS